MNASNWKIEDGRLRKVFKFKNFITAFGFMGQVALIAEKMNHHPNWSNVYNTVTIELFTHSKNEITEKDHILANAIDRIIDEKAS